MGQRRHGAARQSRPQGEGWNPEYPNLLGSPETVKGKTFLYTQSSSQHFGMSEYLKALGLTEKDVVMQNMDGAGAGCL
mgnify:CR=1 FL=1